MISPVVNIVGKVCCGEQFSTFCWPDITDDIGDVVYITVDGFNFEFEFGSDFIIWAWSNI